VIFAFQAEPGLERSAQHSKRSVAPDRARRVLGRGRLTTASTIASSRFDLERQPSQGPRKLSAMTGTPSAAVIGRGIYDPREVARLARLHPETLARWTTGPDALVGRSHERFFDFEDLVSLLVVAELWQRNVRLEEIRRGIEALAGELGVDRPLAHIDARERLATVGRSFFADVDGWADAGKWLQLAFQPMIEPVLRPLEYGTDGMAQLWRPVPAVVAAPVVQAGTPCIEGTRVPTSTITGLVVAGEGPADIAFDLDLEIEQIEAALRFEAQLDERRSLVPAR
jgi:uncharacterized protein (DUF433 family)